MGRYFTAILVLLITGTACTKDKQLKKELEGSWELASFQGYPGNINYPPGNGNIVVFTSGGNFEKRLPGNSTVQGQYTIKTKDDCSPRANNKLLTMNSGAFNEESYLIVQGNTLTLETSNCLADGGKTVYRKM